MELWEELENKVRTIVGGKATPGSGRFNTKGDVRTKTLYIECKHRSNARNRNLGIPSDWLDTAEKNTRVNGLIPLIAYQEDRNGTPTTIAWFCRKVDLELFDEGELWFGKRYSHRDNWIQISQSEIEKYADDNQ